MSKQLNCFLFLLLNRRLHNLDVEVEASGFTRDMSDSFDEVWLCKDQTGTGWEGRERPGKLTLFLHIPSSIVSVDAMKHHPPLFERVDRMHEA